MSVEKILTQAKSTYKERNKEYGNAHMKHGQIMVAMFPDGITLKTESDFRRFMHFSGVIAKMNRYSANFEKGGHMDSVIDPINMLAMLADADMEE